MEAGQILCASVLKARWLLTWFSAELQDECEQYRASADVPLNMLQAGFGPQFGRRQVAWITGSKSSESPQGTLVSFIK